MTSCMGRLHGRVVVVTGGGRGIGRAIALRCAQEGARVALAGRSLDALTAVRDELAAGGSDSIVLDTDVRDLAGTTEMAARTEAELGPIDVLVANSGVGGPTGPLWQLSLEDWEHTHAVNVRGVFLSCRAVLPGMVTRRSGSVVVIGSMSGKRPLANRTAYASSKTALIGLVRSLASEVGPYGVRVNLVSPGPVAGSRLDAVLAAAADAAGRPLEDLRQANVDSAPLRHLVEPDQVAAAVAFLASDESAATTGEDLNVSAGITMY